MHRILLPTALLLVPFLFACSAPRSKILPGSLDGNLELIGQSSGEWPEVGAAEAANFVWVYDTTAWETGAEASFHEMKTTLRCIYDPDAMTVRGAWVSNTGEGHAFRHLCVTPQPDGRLMVRVITLLDGRDEDLTVARFNGPDPTDWICEEFGIGPTDGLVEGVEILFHDDGTWTAIPSRNANMAGKDMELVRLMNVSPDFTDLDRKDFFGALDHPLP